MEIKLYIILIKLEHVFFLNFKLYVIIIQMLKNYYNKIESFITKLLDLRKL